MLTDTSSSPYAQVVPLPAGAVRWKRGLWKEETALCASSTIPVLRQMFDDPEISHVIENFKICAGISNGHHAGTVFGDGDFYKWMEAAVYAAADTGDQKLMDDLDGYIELIADAQQPDGYLSTKQIISEREGRGIIRMSDINDFEVYNFGHLFTAASLHNRLTGKTSFLHVAEKAADCLDGIYRHAQKEGHAETAVCPSHYMGLIELYRTTGKRQYLELAETAVLLRDTVRHGSDDNQDRIPLKEQREIVGHAVRANYLYAGVADLYLETGDPAYESVLQAVWDDLMTSKIYITGGCGALYNGVSPYGNFFVHHKIHQAYGYAYQLPNITAYNETCANIGLCLWAYRMFLASPKGAYFDVIERVMLNTNLAAVSLDGTKFFYENMLERTGPLKYELVWPLERTGYITSCCCPPNLARTLAESAEYAYTVSSDTIYTGLYGDSRAEIRLKNGTSLTLYQETDYPWDGKITFRFEERSRETPAALAVRIPTWAEMFEATCDDRPVETTEIRDGYLFIPIPDKPSSVITVVLQMPVRYTMAHDMVEEARRSVAVERGPLVFCMEDMDTEADLYDLSMLPVPDFHPVPMIIQNRRILTLEGPCEVLVRDHFDRNALYQTYHDEGRKRTSVRMIPYYAWDNRGRERMKIWFPLA